MGNAPKIKIQPVSGADKCWDFQPIVVSRVDGGLLIETQTQKMLIPGTAIWVFIQSIKWLLVDTPKGTPNTTWDFEP